MLEVEIKHDINKNYMVVPAKKEPSYMVQMLDKKKLSGFLPLEVRRLNGVEQYYYDITGMDNLLQVTARSKWSYGQYVAMVSQVLETLGSAKNYLLTTEHFVLEPEYIYWKGEEERVFLCYSWEYSKSINGQLTDFFSYFLKEIDYDDQKLMELAYGLYDASREENCTLQRLWKEFSSEACFVIEEEHTWKQEQNTKVKDCDRGKEGLQFAKKESDEDEGGTWKKAFRSLFGKDTTKNPVIFQPKDVAKKVKPEKRESQAKQMKQEVKEQSKETYVAWEKQVEPIKTRVKLDIGKRQSGGIEEAKKPWESKEQKERKKFWKSKEKPEINNLCEKKEKQKTKEKQKQKIKKVMEGKEQKERKKFWKSKEKQDIKSLHETKEKKETQSYEEIKQGDERVDRERIPNAEGSNFGGYEKNSPYIYQAASSELDAVVEEESRWKVERERKLSEQRIVRPEDCMFGQTANECTVFVELKDNGERMIACYLHPEKACEASEASIAMSQFPCYIGRYQRNTEQLREENSISRIHCKIDKAENKYYLVDLNSTNGTFCNGRRLASQERVEIQEGDLVKLADIAFYFSLSDVS